MVHLRRRGIGLVGGAVLLFLAGTNIQSGWLFVLSSLLLGAALGGALVPALMVRGLSVERDGPDEAFVGDGVPVSLAVTNLTGGTKLSVTVRDPHIAPASVFFPKIAGRLTVVARSERVATRRGVTEAGAVTVSSSAPFGVAEARRRVGCPGRTVIFPRIVPLRHVPFVDPGMTPGSGVAPAGSRGEGTEYAGVREYRRGDSMRHVHWPATARHGSLVVREMERERPGGIAVLVDTWGDAGAEDTVLDLCCTVAGSVALAALAEGHDVEMSAAREGGVETVARAGRSQTLRWLAGVTASGRPFPHVVQDVLARPSDASALLLVLPTWRPNTPAAMASALRSLRALPGGAMRVTAAILDVLEVRASDGHPAPALTGAQTQDLDAALRSAGVDVRRIGSFEDVASLEGAAGGRG